MAPRSVNERERRERERKKPETFSFLLFKSTGAMGFRVATRGAQTPVKGRPVERGRSRPSLFF